MNATLAVKATGIPYSRMPPFHPNTRENASWVVDVNSFARNSTSTVRALTPLSAAAGAFVAGSSILGGVLGVPIGLAGVRDSWIKGRLAYHCGHTEGVLQNVFWASVGGGYAGLSGLLVADGILTLQGAAVSAAIMPAFGGFGLVMSAGAMAYGIHGALKASHFGSRLREKIDTLDAGEVISWLNEQINSPEGKSSEKNWRALEFRIGAEATEAFSKFTSKSSVAMSEKKELVLEVLKGNYKEKVKHITLIAIGVISALACIFIFVHGGAFLTPLFFAIGALMWLAVDSSKLHNYIGEKCWQVHYESQWKNHPFFKPQEETQAAS